MSSPNLAEIRDAFGTLQPKLPALVLYFLRILGHKIMGNVSEQINLWGVNYYHSQYNDESFIEFDSMINIKPNQNNTSRDVESESVRAKITKISYDWIVENNE